MVAYEVVVVAMCASSKVECDADAPPQTSSMRAGAGVRPEPLDVLRGEELLQLGVGGIRLARLLSI